MGTHSNNQPPPILVFTYGNPSRGDDALGPAMFELLLQYKESSSEFDKVELLTDYQLQIEHSVDIEQREYVLFIDASLTARAPCELHRLQAERDLSYTSHAMSPAAVLAIYQQLNSTPPPAYALSIRGYEFELGEPLSARANNNLQQSFEFVIKLLETRIENYREKHIIQGIPV